MESMLESQDCWYCDEAGDHHYIEKCEKFGALSIQQKVFAVKNKFSLCQNCLRIKCDPGACAMLKCHSCHGHHNSILHSYYSEGSTIKLSTSNSSTALKMDALLSNSNSTVLHEVTPEKSITSVNSESNSDISFQKTLNDIFHYDKDGYVLVYCGGCFSCKRGSNPYNAAGIGVYWGENHAMNISESVNVDTNNKSEILAVAKALKQGSEINITKLRIFSDSNYVKNVMTVWMPHWKVNGWRNAQKKPIANVHELKILDENMKAVPDIDIISFPSNKPNSSYGNKQADKLAKWGMLQSTK